MRGSEECGACEATEPENEAIVVPRHSQGISDALPETHTVKNDVFPHGPSFA